MGTPRVSVIVPFLDVRPHLARCIASLLQQTLGREAYELIFVDNNSRDGGAARVAAEPWIRLLRETTQGVYAARNRGVREARGDILAFTDPDCEVRPDWLARLLAALERPGAGIVLGCRLPPEDRGPLRLLMAYEAQKAAYVTGSGVPELFFGHANNMGVTRAVMERVGPFPEVVRGGDTILVRRAVDLWGCSIVRYDPHLRVRHLEVGTLWGFYRKNRTYGQSNHRLRALISHRPLGARERWQVFRETVRQQRWSPLRGALLLALLLPGALCYEAGRRAVLRDARRRGPVAVGRSAAPSEL